MARKRRTPSPTVVAYRKERRRVQSLIRRYVKKYGEVDIQLPSVPKKITQASIRRLQSITPARVKSKTYVPHPDTGERIRLTTALKNKLELPKPFNPPSSPKVKVETSRPNNTELHESVPDYTDIILQNFSNMVAMYPDAMQEVVQQWMSKVLENLNGDRSKLADAINEAAENGQIATYQEAYNMALVYENLSRMTQYLDISASEKNAIVQEIDGMNDFEIDLY